MPVVDLNCRKCGKEVTEYAENLWQCLHCGAKYKYEKPTPLNAVPSVTIKKNTRVIAARTLYDSDGIKVTPSMIFEGGNSTPVSSIVGIEQETTSNSDLVKETYCTAWLSAGFGVLAFFFGIRFLFDIATGLDVIVGGFLISCAAASFIPLRKVLLNPPTQRFSYKEKIFLKENREVFFVFTDIKKATLFETAVNTAIAAHV